MNIRAAIPGISLMLRSQQPGGEALGVTLSDAILVLNEAEGSFWSASTILGNLLLQSVEVKIFGRGEPFLFIIPRTCCWPQSEQYHQKLSAM